MENEMHKLFNVESGFFRFMAKIADIFILNFMFLVINAVSLIGISLNISMAVNVVFIIIGIFTIGPSLTAIYYIMLKEVRDEQTSVVGGFFKAFLRDFAQSIKLFIIVGSILGFLGMDVYLVFKWYERDYTTMPKVVLGLMVGIFIIVLTGMLYVFPMCAKFSNTTIAIVKNSVAMSIANLPNSIGIVLIFAVSVALVIYKPVTIAFIVGLCTFAQSFLFVSVFDKYISKEEVEEEEKDLSATEEEVTHIVITEDNMPKISDDKTDDIPNVDEENND